MTTVWALAKMGVFNMIELHNPPLEKTATCEKHGDFIARCFFGTRFSCCPICTKEQNEKEEAEKAKKEAKRLLDIWQQKIGNSGIPERFKDRYLSSYVINPNNHKQQRIFDFCKSYADDFANVKKTGRSFLMLGTVGTGKTHLSIGIALEIIKAGHTSIFTSASKIFRAIKDTYQKNSNQKESEIMAIYTKCDLLIIDEVGVQRGSDFEKETFFDVINERYENMLPTIILSNLTIDEIKEFLGERVFDRLRENGGKAFLLDWPSHRAVAHYD